MPAPNRRLDLLSILGLLLALCSLLVGAVLKGAGISSLLSTAAFTIVVGGTFAAICVQTPWPVMKHALSILGWILRPPEDRQSQLLEQFVDWSVLAHKQGLLSLENTTDSISDPFLRKGMMLVVDGHPPEFIRTIMEVETDLRDQADMRAAKVYEGMGIYAPTMGIIGAVLGLIAVMKNMGDPAKLGHGVAAAFTATIYGISLANLFFLPISNKLKQIIHVETMQRTMIIEGLVAMAQGDGHRKVESRLRSFIG